MLRNRRFQLKDSEQVFLVDELQSNYEREMKNARNPKKYGFWKFLDENLENGSIREMPHRFYGRQRVQ